MTRKSFYLIQKLLNGRWQDISNADGEEHFHVIKQRFDKWKAAVNSPHFKIRIINREIRDTVHEESK